MAVHRQRIGHRSQAEARGIGSDQRRVAVIEHRHLIGRQLDDRRQLAREAGRRLPGPAVAKIQIHRAVMQRMGGFDHRADARRAAEVLDRAAVVRAQIGHRDAELVEAELVQRANQRPVDMSQLDFSEKAAGMGIDETETASEQRHQFS